MSTARLSENSRVQGILNRCRRQILLHTVLNGGALILIAVLSGLLLSLTLDFLLGLPGRARVILLGACVISTAWIAWKTLICRMLRRIPRNELGAAVDLSAPDLQESLTTLISLQRPEVTAGEAGSRVMREHLEERVVQQLQTLDLRGFVDNRKLLRRFGMASLVLIVALLPAVLWPDGSRILLARLITPLADHESATNLFFEVTDGNRVVALGSDVQIVAVPGWRSGTIGERPESVELVLESASGHADVLPMTFDEALNGFVGTIPEIPESLAFRVRSGSTLTRRYQLTAVAASDNPVSRPDRDATRLLWTGR